MSLTWCLVAGLLALTSAVEQPSFQADSSEFLPDDDVLSPEEQAHATDDNDDNELPADDNIEGASRDNSVEGTAGVDRPTWADYAAQQQTNAELAARIAELTHATHVLWHEERTLRRQAHHKVQQAHRMCRSRQHHHHNHHHQHQPAESSAEGISGAGDSTTPSQEDISAATAALASHANGQSRQLLPWSLTHAASKHRRTRGSGKVPSVGSLAGLYNAPEDTDALSHNKGRSLEEVEAEKRQLEDELSESRASLGKHEEARVHLEETVRALEAQFAHGEQLAAQKKQEISEAETQEKKMEEELMHDKSQLKSQKELIRDQKEALRNELGATIEEEQDKIEQEKHDLLTFRNKADAKLRARKVEEKSAKANTVQLQHDLAAAKTEENQVQEKIAKATQENERLKQEVQKLQASKAEVANEERTEEQRLASENERLREEERQEQQCMDWGHRLEARLQRELKDKMNDAKLCRDSILSLHNERLELKGRAEKYKRAIEEAKLHEEEARRSSEENKALLDHCLEQMQAQR